LKVVGIHEGRKEIDEAKIFAQILCDDLLGPPLDEALFPLDAIVEVRVLGLLGDLHLVGKRDDDELDALLSQNPVERVDPIRRLLEGRPLALGMELVGGVPVEADPVRLEKVLLVSAQPGVEIALAPRPVVYAKSWSSVSQYESRPGDQALREGFMDWCVDEPWFETARGDCKFMHCLPVRQTMIAAFICQHC